MNRRRFFWAVASFGAFAFYTKTLPRWIKEWKAKEKGATCTSFDE